MKNSVLESPPGTGIKKALAHARVVPVVTNLGDRESHLKQIRGIRSQLLPVEAETSAELAKQEEAALGELGLAKILQSISHLGETRLLDPAAFALRNKDGLPILAPFGLATATATIRSEGTDSIPACCGKYYADVKKKLATRNSFLCSLIFPIFALALACLFFGLNDVVTPYGFLKGAFPVSLALGLVLCFLVCLCGFEEGEVPGSLAIGGVALLASVGWPITLLLLLGSFSRYCFKRLWLISAKFSGMIPAVARAKIREAQKCGGLEEIFLLAEVSKWEIRSEPVPVPTMKGDPLTIGWDGKNFWLLDAWDTTTAEQYIAEEFASNPKA